LTIQAQNSFVNIFALVDSLDPDFRYGRLEALTEVYVGDAVGKIRKESCDILGDHELPQLSHVYRVHPLLRSSSDEVSQLPFRAYIQPLVRDHEITKLFKVRKIRKDQQDFKLSPLKFKRSEECQPIAVSLCPIIQKNSF
jgi:hypothetical protein